MSRVSRLVRRSDVFYFRAAVPRSLTKRLGLHEIKLSLRTSDPTLAKVRSRVLSNAADLLFEDISRVRSLKAADIHERVKDYFREALSQALEMAYLLPADSTVDLAEERAGLAAMLERKQEQLACRNYPPSVKWDAHKLLNPSNHSGDGFDQETLQQAYSAILRANIESERILAAQLAGRYDETLPRDPLFQGIVVAELPPISGEPGYSTGVTQSLDIVGKRFMEFRSKAWAPKTAADVHRVLNLASEIIGGEKAVNLLDIDDVKAVRDALVKLPPNYMKSLANKDCSIQEAIANNSSGKSLAWATQDKYFTMFRQFLLWMADEGYIEKAPGPGVKIAGPGKSASERRKPYSQSQLKAIFSSPLYTGHESGAKRWKPGTQVVRDGKFWVPVIALFTGMRMGEIVQLQPSDLKREDGVWFFDLAEGEGKTFKTKSSLRRIPIHSQLLRMGILGLGESAEGKDRLFSDIEKGSDGYFSHNFSKFWGRYARNAGFGAPSTSFHSFRHNFVDALRAVALPQYVNEALLGHAAITVHGSYGSTSGLKQLRKGVDKVTYNLDLAFLEVAPWSLNEVQ